MPIQSRRRPSPFPSRLLDPAIVLALLLGGAVAIWQAYQFNAEGYACRTQYLSRLAMLKPLGWNPYETQWAARPAQIKMLVDQRYLTSWYTSLGHAEVTVLIWTFL